MTKREAKRRAAQTAAAALQSLLDCGWPHEMVGGGDPPEPDVDLRRMTVAMSDLVDELEVRSKARPA